MVYFKANNTLYPAEITGRENDRDWNNRQSKSVKLTMTYEDANTLFVNDLVWSQVYQPESYVNEDGEVVTPDPIETDNSDYSVAGSITDHRDGTITVKMGKLTANEILAELEATYDEE